MPNISHGTENGGKSGPGLGLLAVRNDPGRIFDRQHAVWTEYANHLPLLPDEPQRCLQFAPHRVGYNNFLRLRLAEDGFDVFAVGLEEVPSRDDWIANPKHKQGHPDSEQPVFLPKVDLKPHLIEKVSVQFKKSQVTPTSAVGSGASWRNRYRQSRELKRGRLVGSRLKLAENRLKFREKLQQITGKVHRPFPRFA